jgi:hypothetical protein
MLIALDFDGTYTEDPALWNAFVVTARNRGHKVICCTMRYDREGEEVILHLGDKVDQIIFTGRKNKIEFLSNMGISPKVWIDDNPHWIYQDAD